MQYAKTHLSALLARVEDGEEILISRGDQLVARLAPILTSTERELGFLDLRIPESVFVPLPDDELEAWDGPAG